jgi:hypothetical protein
VPRKAAAGQGFESVGAGKRDAQKSRKALRSLPALSVQFKTFRMTALPEGNKPTSALTLTVAVVRSPRGDALSGPRRRIP